MFVLRHDCICFFVTSTEGIMIFGKTPEEVNCMSKYTEKQENKNIKRRIKKKKPM